MKQWLLLLILIGVFLFLAGNWENRDRAPEGVSIRKSHLQKITLTYVNNSSTTGAPGHQAYRIDDSWASSREEIVRLMALAGWSQIQDPDKTGVRLSFEKDDPGRMVSPIHGIRWEKD